MEPCYTVHQIRQAEQPLLAAQNEPDALMKQAAAAVSSVAASMLNQDVGKHKAVLLLVGSGGNGGDALYAGAHLIAQGYDVHARIFGNAPHIRALDAFQAAGGHICTEPLEVLVWNVSENYALLIDGIVGIGGKGPLREEPAWIIREAAIMNIPILAVDVPSGVSADSGETFPGPTNTLNADPDLPEDVPAYLPGHVTATATVTFGGLRYAHAVSHACGTVVLADISLPNRADFCPSEPAGCSLGHVLARQIPPSEIREADDCDWSVRYVQAVPEYRRRGHIELADCLVAEFRSSFKDLEPQVADNKYSGGVVGIAAGSQQYPGAAILCATGAVRATSSAVHFFGGCAIDVVRAVPCVIARERIHNPRVNAWVVGPGRGTGDEAVDELVELLLADEPLVIDADAITVLAANTHLQGLVRERALRGAQTVLTPHAGEFERLRAGLAGPAQQDPTHAPEPEADITGIPDPDKDPIGAAQHLAMALQCVVLLKGHRTVVAEPPLRNHAELVYQGSLTVIDAGSSWAATPGSGDVLSGVIGAWLARGEAGERHCGAVETAVVIHSRASEIAARTEYGYAPTDALAIAEAIRPATAKVLHRS